MDEKEKYIDAIIYDAYGYFITGGKICNAALIKSDYENGDDEYKNKFWECVRHMEKNPAEAGFKDCKPVLGFVDEIKRLLND